MGGEARSIPLQKSKENVTDVGSSLRESNWGKKKLRRRTSDPSGLGKKYVGCY